jgi:RecB family endonuclease NucS
MVLKRVGESWVFVSEAALENFACNNLDHLFGLTLLKRQYFVKGEICDILAVDNLRRLVVLELKNCQDRYIVQQLTRYYDSLLEEKVFKQEVNYDLPVRLIAVAPNFHRHNLVDRKYTNLSIDFFQFSVLKDCQSFFIDFKNLETNQILRLEIPYQEIDCTSISKNIPVPPNLILECLGSYTEKEQQAILKIRERILNFDPCIREMVDINNIKYGASKAKNKICAEFYFKRRLKEIVLLLWLPIPNRKKLAVGRMQVGTKDWVAYWGFCHMPEGIGKMEIEKANYYRLYEYQNNKPVWVYGYLNELVEEALETWIKKL